MICRSLPVKIGFVREDLVLIDLGVCLLRRTDLFRFEADNPVIFPRF